MKIHLPSILIGALVASNLFLLSAFMSPAPVRDCLTQEQEDILALFSLTTIPDCSEGPGYLTLRLTGANLQIVNGSDETANANGLGNLIIGYQEADGVCEHDGSHNIIVGHGNAYSSYGSLIVGEVNNSYDKYQVIFGVDNTNYGSNSSILGGISNTILGSNGNYNVIVGGDTNTIDDNESNVLVGGYQNYNIGLKTVLLGGIGNNIGNTDYAVLVGGSSNTANGSSSVLGGGNSRTASGTDDFVAGTLFEDN